MPDIGLSLNTNLRQQQEQQLAPAQLQGLEILQATNLELQQRVSQALMQNPILEQVNQPLTINEDDALREMRQRSPDAEDIRAARDFDGDAQEYRAEAFAQAAESVPEQMPSYDSDGEAIPANEVEEPEYRGLRSTADDEYYPVVSRDPDAEERRKFLLDSVPSEDGYYTKLLRQVAVLQVPQPVRELCAKLVGELNERGYLERSDEELAEEYAGRVEIGKYNVDDESDLANDFRVVSIPTLLFFKNGEMQKDLRTAGLLPKAEVVARIEALLAR